MQAVLPRPDIAPLIEEGYILLAGDPDDPDPKVHELMFKLPNANMLPIVLVADADGTFVKGKSGLSDPARVKEFLES